MRAIRPSGINEYVENSHAVTGYVALLTTQVMCQEFSQCYDDVNICLWTDDSPLLTATQSEAQTACQRRDNSFLPRITNSNVQSKLADFRNNVARAALGGNGFWIAVTANINHNWQWIVNIPLAGGFVSVVLEWYTFVKKTYSQPRG